jgi:hypothetical protein
MAGCARAKPSLVRSVRSWISVDPAPTSTMRRIALPLLFGSLLTAACNRETHEVEHGAEQESASRSEPGLAPRVQPPAPEPAPTPAPTPEPEPAPTPEPNPVLDERKQALANVGRSAFEALQAGDFGALLQLTPLVDGYLRDVCPALPVSPREQLEARFDFCKKSIPWADVAEAQAFAAQPTGEPAAGCNAGIEEYGRLQLFVHMNDKSIWRVDFFGAIGQDGNPIGINGEVSCRPVDEAEKLK